MRTAYQNLMQDLDKEHASAIDVCKLLNRHGFRRIGKGLYSNTFGKKDEPYVVKVNLSPDPASFKFYSTVFKNTSAYFPRIHKLRSFVTNTGDFLFFVVMERLKHITDTTWSQANKDGVGFASWLACHPESTMDLVYDDPDCVIRATTWEKQNPSYVAILSSIVSSIRKFGYVDFHDDNLMVRLPEGDIVLTDPVGTYANYH